MNSFRKDHDVSLPYAYQASVTKRIVGALVTNICELERGIFQLRDAADGIEVNAECAPIPGPEDEG
jgi:hypothetical protein